MADILDQTEEGRRRAFHPSETPCHERTIYTDLTELFDDIGRQAAGMPEFRGTVPDLVQQLMEISALCDHFFIRRDASQHGRDPPDLRRRGSMIPRQRTPRPHGPYASINSNFLQHVIMLHSFGGYFHFFFV
ncbi:hypothetical protein AAC691_08665 [Nguyenibacter vanlangensis]|uniref:Uncharacterized protein n=1 Tax=Nguyenibacter vanlangensis TaxID=1216886 RepID=A0ABZ3D9M7_9PROT